MGRKVIVRVGVPCQSQSIYSSAVSIKLFLADGEEYFQSFFYCRYKVVQNDGTYLFDISFCKK